MNLTPLSSKGTCTGRDHRGELTPDRRAPLTPPSTRRCSCPSTPRPASTPSRLEQACYPVRHFWEFKGREGGAPGCDQQTPRESDSPRFGFKGSPVAPCAVHRPAAGTKPGVRVGQTRRCYRLDKQQSGASGLGLENWERDEHSGLGADIHPNAEIKLAGGALRL